MVKIFAKMVLMRQEKGASEGEALNARSIRGGTPLHVAVAHNQPRMVALLLAQPEIVSDSSEYRIFLQEFQEIVEIYTT